MLVESGLTGRTALPNDGILKADALQSASQCTGEDRALIITAVEPMKQRDRHRQYRIKRRQREAHARGRLNEIHEIVAQPEMAIGLPVQHQPPRFAIEDQSAGRRIKGGSTSPAVFA